MNAPEYCPACHASIPGGFDKENCPACGENIFPGPSEPLAIPPVDGDKRPGIGKSIMETVESMFASKDMYIVKSDIALDWRLAWDDQAAAKLEHDLCPMLAHALIQPLQFEWIIEHLVAVQLVEIEQKDKTLQEATRVMIATYLMMACQQLPWPTPPAAEAEETGGASVS